MATKKDKKHMILKETQIREWITDLQLSEDFLNAFEAKIKLDLLRCADRCRANSRKRLESRDV